MILHYQVTGHDQTEIETNAKAVVPEFFTRLQTHEDPIEHRVLHVFPNYREYRNIGGTYDAQDGWKAEVVAGPRSELNRSGQHV